MISWFQKLGLLSSFVSKPNLKQEVNDKINVGVNTKTHGKIGQTNGFLDIVTKLSIKKLTQDRGSIYNCLSFTKIDND